MNVINKKQFFFSKKLLIQLTFFIALLVLLNIFSSQFKNFFYIISSPISNVFIRVGGSTNKFFTSFLIPDQLRQENIVLQEENQKLLSDLSTLKDKLKEKYDLSMALEGIKDSEFKIILSKVVGVNLLDDSLSINKGEKDGISEGMPVISKNNVVFGRVIKVYENFSKVLLISAKNSSINVKIQSQDDGVKSIYGVLKGSGNLNMYLDLVDSELEIKEGDVLATSGLEGFFPRNLIIGEIASVNKSDLKPFQTAIVKHFFEIPNMDNLFIITNYKK